MLTLLFFAACCPYACAQTQLEGGTQQQVLQTGTKTQVLQGGVNHSSKLAPVEKKLHSGSKFDVSAFDDVVPNNLWVPIPPWFAGVWETRTETQLETVNLQPDMGMGGMGMDGSGMDGMGMGSGSAQSSEPKTFARTDKWVFGMQTDKHGQIWHFINVPSRRRVQVGDSVEFRYELSKEFLHTGQNRVLSRYRFTAVIVDDKTQKIVESRQQETLLLFKPETPDKLRAFGSIKLFSQEGIPLMLSSNFTPFFRLQEYAPIATYRGIDMQKSLREYLLSHGMAERVPD